MATAKTAKTTTSDKRESDKPTATENTDPQGNELTPEKEISESDLPSREDSDVRLLSAEADDPNDEWTSQDDNAFVAPQEMPGQYVDQHELPTKEGLAEIGVADPEAYLAGVHVRK